MGIVDNLLGLKKKQSKQRKQSKQNKQTIYWDVDDVILNTTETIVQLINEKYRIPNNLEPKTADNCKDWSFKGIWRPLTERQQEELFESDEFWNRVEIREEFIKMIESGVLDNYKNVFVTKGSPINLRRKKEYLEAQLYDVMDKFEYIGLFHEQDKGEIDMRGGIQIDDNYKNIKDTNARLKILMKNNREASYNNSLGYIDTLDNLYNVNYLEEIQQILEFNLVQRL